MTEEATPFVQHARLLKDADAKARTGFVRKVYGILSAQLLLTFAFAMQIQALSLKHVEANRWVLYLSTAALFGTLLLMLCRPSTMRSYPTNYALLSVLTACLAVNAGFASAVYTWQSVALAVGIAAGVFLGMTIYASVSKADFTGAGPYIWAAASCLCCFGLALSILNRCGVRVDWAMMCFDLCGVLLFTFYIVYDTQLMLGGDRSAQLNIDDYCLASLSLYLDILNLFVHLLKLVGKRRA